MRPAFRAGRYAGREGKADAAGTAGEAITHDPPSAMEESEMANIRDWLLEATAENGETIEAIVVGKHDSVRWSEGEPNALENVVLTPEQGLALLDQEYDNGYGGADCRPMYAWTATRIYLIGEYDGATGPYWVPRNPIACEPGFGGQYL